jgi:hypothetical protein
MINARCGNREMAVGWFQQLLADSGAEGTSESGRPVVPRQGLVIGGRQLPAILEPSITDHVVALVQRNVLPRDGRTVDRIWYSDLLDGRPEVLWCTGIGGNAVIPVQRPADPGTPSTPALNEGFWDDGARLFLDTHRLGQHGFLRIRLLLPRTPKPLDAVATLSDGDIQKFLAAAHETESVDVYVHGEASLSYTFQADGIGAAIDQALADLLTMESAAGQPSNCPEINVEPTPEHEIALGLPDVDHDDRDVNDIIMSLGPVSMISVDATGIRRRR